MDFLYTRNVSPQSVAVLGNVNLGTLIRQHYETDKCGTRTFSIDNGNITLQLPGIYKVTVIAIVSAPAAGNVTLQLLENGELIPGALATETITTASTESRIITIQAYVLVNTICLLGQRSTLAKTLSVVNTGVASTVSTISATVERMYR